MSLVIVAIPPQDDYVWKISSEKVPHMTLLFLGDKASPAAINNIVGFVEHASKTLDRFGMSVDYRGELGADKADVLFFNECKAIKEFRSQLLKNTQINRAYKSVEQFDGWTPHLTLGYPATPAKEDERDYPGFNWVNFDRIAVWTGDFEGPEFRLQDNMDTVSGVYMSNTTQSTMLIGKDFLDHHGVKGQKWGVRRNKTTGVRPLAQTLNDSRFGRRAQKNVDTHNRRAGARADKKWQKNIYTVKSAVEIHNRVADKMNNGGLDRLNNNPAFKGKRMISKTGEPLNTPESKAYFKAYEKMNEQFTRQAVKEIHGTSPSGGFKATLDTKGDQWSVKVVPVEVGHAADPVPTIEMDVEYDSDGFITLHHNVRDGELAQSTVKMGEDYLEHFGVKGMKWGVRAARTIHNARKAPKPMSEDAQRHAAAKKKKLSELSDKELKDLALRLNMEQQVKRMNPASITKGHNAAKAVVAVVGTASAIHAIGSSPLGKKIGKTLAKAVAVDVTGIGKTKPARI